MQKKAIMHENDISELFIKAPHLEQTDGWNGYYGQLNYLIDKLTVYRQREQ